MNILFIGGDGTISFECSKEVLRRGHSLTLLKRKDKPVKGLEEATIIASDINDTQRVKTVLKGKKFDAVVDFIAFNEKDILRDYELFKGKTEHYIFISSASGYSKPIKALPIKETASFNNNLWDYSNNKVQAEKALFQLNDDTFNVTALRPSHTYDDQKIIAQIKSDDSPFTIIDRILNNQPLVLANDGTTRWTLTHSIDFAKAFVDLLGNKKAYNEAFHLTSAYSYTWNEIMQALYDALDKKPYIKHIDIKDITHYFPSLKGPLLGDKLNDLVFDNTKIKQIAPNYQSSIDYKERIAYIVNNYLNKNYSIDQALNDTLDDLIKTVN